MNTAVSLQVKSTLKDRLENVLGFSRPDGWDRLSEHIAVHKHLKSLTTGESIDWNEAITSWHAEVFTPLLAAIQRYDFYAAFPDRPLGDIYLEVSDHWHFLRRRSPSATPIEAADSYANQYGNKLRRTLSRIAGRLRRRPVFERLPDVLHPDERRREAHHDKELRKEIWG